MSVNPASNYPNLAQLNNAVLAYSTSGSTVQNRVQSFLSALTEATYTPMVAALADASNNLASGANASLRILLAIDDGTVAYDSSKGANNTFANFSAKTINENHNTRPEILVAILGNSGVGLSNRYSSSVSSFLKYQATRLGASTQTNGGTFRLSLKDLL
jgi:hypothetical protein